MTSSIDASFLLRQLSEKYNNAVTYQDSGQLLCRFGAGLNQQKNIKFSTYFRQPNFFKFEWSEIFSEQISPRRNIIWCTGKAAYSKYHDGITKRVVRFGLPSLRKDIALAVGRATGVSGTTAHTIPALLMPELSGVRITQLKEVIVLREELMGDDECVWIRGNIQNCFKAALCISKSTYILRKMEVSYYYADALRKPTLFDAPEFQLQDAVTFGNAQINSPIPDEIFNSAL